MPGVSHARLARKRSPLQAGERGPAFYGPSKIYSPYLTTRHLPSAPPREPFPKTTQKWAAFRPPVRLMRRDKTYCSSSKSVSDSASFGVVVGFRAQEILEARLDRDGLVLLEVDLAVDGMPVPAGMRRPTMTFPLRQRRCQLGRRSTPR